MIRSQTLYRSDQLFSSLPTVDYTSSCCQRDLSHGPVQQQQEVMFGFFLSTLAFALICNVAIAFLETYTLYTTDTQYTLSTPPHMTLLCSQNPDTPNTSPCVKLRISLPPRLKTVAICQILPTVGMKPTSLKGLTLAKTSMYIVWKNSFMLEKSKKNFVWRGVSRRKTFLCELRIIILLSCWTNRTLC